LNELQKQKITLEARIGKAEQDLKKMKSRLDEEEVARKELEDNRLKLEKSTKDSIERASVLEGDLKKHLDALNEEKTAHAALKKKVAVLMS